MSKEYKIITKEEIKELDLDDIKNENSDNLVSYVFDLYFYQF